MMHIVQSEDGHGLTFCGLDRHEDRGWWRRLKPTNRYYCARCVRILLHRLNAEKD